MIVSTDQRGGNRFFVATCFTVLVLVVAVVRLISYRILVCCVQDDMTVIWARCRCRVVMVMVSVLASVILTIRSRKMVVVKVKDPDHKEHRQQTAQHGQANRGCVIQNLKRVR